ncbi:hypothetical protein DDD_3515 [Nonlabens dokdonensis DSW-6]|uniref:Uncharacterized protein n=1 Tax=Nonlabens dokdonensis (strain DSM 17205 / KCTC 12402 / DSW-6) TaxID=592029 RepID=L7WEC9_NONDD|nr:hypothetical protein DDD_3515 [Nonlabens dokdonensis DSW-6]
MTRIMVNIKPEIIARPLDKSLNIVVYFLIIIKVSAFAKAE